MFPHKVKKEKCYPPGVRFCPMSCEPCCCGEFWSRAFHADMCLLYKKKKKKSSMQNCIRNLIKLCGGINSFLFSCKALRGLCCSDYLSTSFGGMSI